jgi:hypothetical protein
MTVSDEAIGWQQAFCEIHCNAAAQMRSQSMALSQVARLARTADARSKECADEEQARADNAQTATAARTSPLFWSLAVIMGADSAA